MILRCPRVLNIGYIPRCNRYRLLKRKDTFNRTPVNKAERDSRLGNFLLWSILVASGTDPFSPGPADTSFG